jgi:predicted MFS family arabinose efflux permease
VFRPALTLALCLFANQAGMLVLSPILLDVARDFGVSTAAAGQLRSISGAVAAVTALCIGYLAARIGLRRLLLAGLVTMALAAGLAAASPSFAVLALSQALLGIAIGVLLSCGIAGATAWIPPARRADALSAVLSGQAAAWLVGMPVVGLVGEVSWRLAWLALPLAAAIPAFVLATGLPPVTRRPARLVDELTTLTRDRVVALWWLGEVAAFSAWVGMLVYSGALLIDSYGVSLRETGLLLGFVFVAYVPSSLLFRRHLDRSAGRLLVVLPFAGALLAALIGAVRPTLWLTVPLLAAYVFVNSGRTLSGSAFGLDAAPERAVTAMGIRTSATQLGYLVGAGLGGLALALGGYGALGATFAGLYVLAVVPHAILALGWRAAPSPAAAPNAADSGTPVL